MKTTARKHTPVNATTLPFTEALSERTSIATGYPGRDPSTAARLQVTICAPGEHAGSRTSVLVIVEQSDGPSRDSDEVELYAEDLELFAAVLQHAIREARASGTIPPAA